CDKGKATQAIILVPTRELAVQVDTEIKRLGEFTPIRSVPVYGGQKITAQMKFLKHGPEIVVGTPGRVIDLLDRRIINFNNVRFVVLDEVDRMLDIGFRDDIRNILSRVKGVRAPADARESSEVRGQSSGVTEEATDAEGRPLPSLNSELRPLTSDRHHQTMFVSATISQEIERLARKYMHEPVEKLIAPGVDEKPMVAEVEQWYFSV